VITICHALAIEFLPGDVALRECHALMLVI
jgi:hypothetical protein